MVLDYIDGAASLRPFYDHPVSIEGIKAAILARKNFKTDRELLVNVLKKQYAEIEVSETVAKNMDIKRLFSTVHYLQSKTLQVFSIQKKISPRSTPRARRF